MSLEAFFDDEDKPKWGSQVEKEKRLRIILTVAAYAYEFDSNSIMSDTDFDHLCLRVDKSASTGNKELDKYFKEWFDPSTGQWIHKHPDLFSVKRLYERYYKAGKKYFTISSFDY